METQIINLLQMSRDEYELTVISNYLTWCRSYEKNNTEAQRLIASPELFKWWMAEYRKLENRFVELVVPYRSSISKEDMVRAYKIETIHIHSRFSKPLIYCAKHKRQIINGNQPTN